MTRAGADGRDVDDGRAVSMARSRAIASCWAFSSVSPKSALFVWAMMTCAPSRIMFVTSWSSTMSKQIEMPAVKSPTSIDLGSRARACSRGRSGR